MHALVDMSPLADVNKEYEKDPKIKKEDVENLRLWAEKQPHLPKITELQYILFLQSCYYSNEQAKQAIEKFFTVRTMCKDIFSNGNPNDPRIQMAVDVACVHLLPELTPRGYKVLYMRLRDTNTDKYILTDQLRMFDSIITLTMHLEGTNEGIHFVLDAEGAVFGHLLKFNPTAVRKYLFYLQEALPIRIKDIHIIHVPTWIDKGLALVKPFLKKELYDLIHVHSSLDTFYKIIPKEILPVDLGGGGESVEVLSEKGRARLLQNPEFFKNQEKQLTDESKRSEKTMDYTKIFGLEGTFKKLEVD